MKKEEKKEKKVTKEQVKKTLIATGGAVGLVGLGWFLASRFCDGTRFIKDGCWEGVYHPETKTWSLLTYRNSKRLEKGDYTRRASTNSPEVLEYIIESASDALKQMKGE